MKKLLAWATRKIDKVLRQKLEVVREDNHVYRALLDRQLHAQDADRKVLAKKVKPFGSCSPGTVYKTVHKEG